MSSQSQASYHGQWKSRKKLIECKLAEAGHAQPSTTLAIYTQVYDRRRDEIRNQMSKELYE